MTACHVTHMSQNTSGGGETRSDTCHIKGEGEGGHHRIVKCHGFLEVRTGTPMRGKGHNPFWKRLCPSPLTTVPLSLSLSMYVRMYVCIYILMCVCVCVCVCPASLLSEPRDSLRHATIYKIIFTNNERRRDTNN